MTTAPHLSCCGNPFRSVKVSHWKLLVVCTVVALATSVLVLYSERVVPPERAILLASGDMGRLTTSSRRAHYLVEDLPQPPDLEDLPPPPDLRVPVAVEDLPPPPDLGASVVVEDSTPPPPAPTTPAATEPPPVTTTPAATEPPPVTTTPAATEPPPTPSTSAVVQKPTRRPCPTGGAVTVRVAGRLGNKMWQYATTWATSRKTGLPGFVPDHLRTDLDKVFRSLSVPSDNVIAHCHVNWHDFVDSPFTWSRPEQSVILPVYPFYETLALQWVDDLRREFTFRDELVRASQETLRSLRRSGNVTYVSVHVRRTDYSHHLWVRGKAQLVDENFFLHAMAYFKDKYGDGVVFVVASDDPIWCQKKLATGRSDVVVVGGTGLSTPEQDLAVMAACNHSILDYGTFGVWGAILAKGETVVFNLSVSEETSMIAVKLFKNWRVME